MAEFGERLKNARTEKGLTQQTLADQLYVTRQAVSRWEGGSRYPDLMTAKKLSHILDTSLDELLRDDDLTSYPQKNPILESPVSKVLQTVLISAVLMCYLIICIWHIKSINAIIVSENGRQIFSFITPFLYACVLLYAAIMSIQDKWSPRIAAIIAASYYGIHAFTHLFQMGAFLYRSELSGSPKPLFRGALGLTPLYKTEITRSDPMQNHMSLVKDVRGCMTRFDPLTPDIVASQSQDGLTYEELKHTLSECGMDINKVVFDGSRGFQNAFYADFEQGHYCWIPFQKAGLKAIIRTMDQQFHSPSFGMARKNHEWESFYMMDVPLPMQIYDFERRYKDIEPDRVFFVWSSIHTHIDYSNGMWDPEVLNYVFSHAPKTGLPETDADGKVTIYRGMGEKSQPAEEAISWSTDPVCALWFANRSARGTRLVSARVDPEQILVYNPGYRAEHEVILKPGTKLIIQKEDMIPSTEAIVPKLLAPVTKDFFRFGAIAATLDYPEEHLFQYHGIKHILRVLVLTLLYCQHSGDQLSEEDKQILIYFSLLHDIGRDNEEDDETHGDKSVELIRTKNIRIKGIHLSKKGYRIAKLLIRHHCRSDEIGLERVCKVPGFSQRDIARASRLYRIAKDMDGLDRVRFNGLDFRYLRTPYARRLPLVAGGLLEEPLLECIRSYWEGKLEVPDV